MFWGGFLVIVWSTISTITTVHLFTWTLFGYHHRYDSRGLTTKIKMDVNALAISNEKYGTSACYDFWSQDRNILNS